VNKTLEKDETRKVYCPMCTHTVDAETHRVHGRHTRRFAVKPGQKCPHCSAPLDAGYIFQSGRAA
jgi:DNA-directed RNA polymerase subunit RPC12/RpoP